MLPRVVSDYIPITELPDLMRACGFYLSEYEVNGLSIEEACSTGYVTVF